MSVFNGRYWPFFVFLITLIFCPALLAQTGAEIKTKDEVKSEAGTKKQSSMETVEVKQSVSLGGKNLSYLVRAGEIPIFDKDGREAGRIFSTAYLTEVKDGRNSRPVTFMFNGGPGAASLYLHIGAFGPKYLPLKDQGLEVPRPPYKLADNPNTPLDVTDLVFVDPIGTGFSRAAGKVGEGDDKREIKPSDFWGVEKDLNSMAEFIRVWLTENKRWGSPVFLAGESYGGLRVAGLTTALSDIGVAVSGVALISPALSYQDIIQTSDNFISQIHIVPTFSAIAHYHGRLNPELQALSVEEVSEQARQWAETDLLKALWQGNRLSEEDLKAVAEQMSRFIGIPQDELIHRRLRLLEYQFHDLLLKDRNLITGRYDGRATAPNPGGLHYYYGRGEDPSYTITQESYQSALMDYFFTVLKLSTNNRYLNLNEEVITGWQFNFDPYNGMLGFPGTVNQLAENMRRWPFLQVFLAMGRYDTATPPESALAALSRLEVPRERLKTNIETHIYEGGHMMYTNSEAAGELGVHFRTWLLKALEERH